MKVVLNMKKKLIIAITILGLLAALLVSCTKSVSTPSATTEETSTSENNSIPMATPFRVSTTLAYNFTVTLLLGTTSGTLQSVLPLSVTQPAHWGTCHWDTVTVEGTTTPRSHRKCQ